MYLEIVSPEATLFKGEVTSVAVPGVHGDFEMLNNHAPIVSLLVEGNVRFKGSDVKIEAQFASKFTNNKGEYLLPIKSGTIEMKANKVIVLAD